MSLENEIKDFNNFNNDNFNSINVKQIFFKYFFHWRIFLLSLILILSATFILLRYTHNVYSSTAKIKIIDEKEGVLDLTSTSDLFSNSSINIDNELEILKSKPILINVVEDLNLTNEFFVEGDVLMTQSTEFPFRYVSKINNKDIFEELNFSIKFLDTTISIFYENLDTNYFFNNLSTFNQGHNLPFDISINNDLLASLGNVNYHLKLKPVDIVINQLKNSISCGVSSKKSEIIYLNMKNHNYELSELIINSLIESFNMDGVNDRRLVHRRTIDFVNDRFINLVLELDSIEVYKKVFKVDNNLSDIKANTSYSLGLSSISESEIFLVENQISISKLFKKSLNELNYNLLPSKIGIENIQINVLVNAYNLKILERKKLLYSAGVNNPSLKLLDDNLNELRKNIIFSLDSYFNQLTSTKSKLISKRSKINSDIAQMPANEKVLRNIERNQTIKESLYLFLLKKREEAEVSYAITEPTIKVVEYAITDKNPVSPNNKTTLLASFFLAFFLPFFFLYLRELFNTKIHTKDDIDKLNIGASVIGEIPQIIDSNVVFDDPTERSVLAEAFRMLSSNLKYMLPNPEFCSVILSTSTIKGEGKTFSAVNTSLALSTLNKKVLLIGCDLRNPQLHKYLNLDKSVNGLVNYLVDDKNKWRDSLVKFFDNHPTHDILLSGALPPNPVQLLNNGNLEKLLEDAKKDYDYIILDTAPTILVTDTITISHLADAVLYVSRANLTEKEVLSFPKELILSGKFKNVGIILNGLGAQNKYGYSYGYQYGYGYKYSYNYGYGYGYEEDKEQDL